MQADPPARGQQNATAQSSFRCQGGPAAGLHGLSCPGRRVVGHGSRRRSRGMHAHVLRRRERPPSLACGPLLHVAEQLVRRGALRGMRREGPGEDGPARAATLAPLPRTGDRPASSRPGSPTHLSAGSATSPRRMCSSTRPCTCSTVMVAGATSLNGRTPVARWHRVAAMEKMSQASAAWDKERTASANDATARWCAAPGMSLKALGAAGSRAVCAPGLRPRWADKCSYEA